MTNCSNSLSLSGGAPEPPHQRRAGYQGQIELFVAFPILSGRFLISLLTSSFFPLLLAKGDVEGIFYWRFVALSSD
jgi:hypothetical protein